MKKTNAAQRRSKLFHRIIGLLALLAGLFVAASVLPVGEYLSSILTWTEDLGVWGPVVVAAFYVLACVFMLPGSVLTLGAGFLFGVVAGTITVSIGSTLGACAAFLVGRTIARGWVGAKISGRPKFAAIDEAVAREGFKIVLLTRLSPVFPFNFQNYAYGLTKVSFWQYALASWIGMLPGTVMYVYFGHAARAAAKSISDIAAGQVEGGQAERIFFWIGLAVAVAVAVFVAHVARRALKQAVPASQTESTTY